VVSSENLENDSQVDLNLQILFAVSHENISKEISSGTSMLLRRIKTQSAEHKI